MIVFGGKLKSRKKRNVYPIQLKCQDGINHYVPLILTLISELDYSVQHCNIFFKKISFSQMKHTKKKMLQCRPRYFFFLISEISKALI